MFSALRNGGGNVALNAYAAQAVVAWMKGEHADMALVDVGGSTYAAELPQADGTVLIATVNRPDPNGKTVRLRAAIAKPVVGTADYTFTSLPTIDRSCEVNLAPIYLCLLPIATSIWNGVGTDLNAIVHVEYPETAFSEIQGGTNKEKVFSFLTEELGLNNAAACGVMANIQNESGFNPARHEDKNAYGDGLGEGYGLCQWSYSRKTSLLSFLQENGFAEDSIDGQLWFFKTEIESSERTAWNAIKDLPNTSDGAYEAGRLWCLKFERPRDGVGDSVERGNLAQNTYWPAYGGR